ncbi:ABC transporter substrate-binding protein [Motiliproteus sp. MSK22-1]|uniref:substrate-binding periplasmic protein n=1 Tax=Motiliproteus sp. MSK22-1 TaxID=1897630 RepID=UPI000978B7D7|nr:ABC transporter substrate-binding protein [Motiliproteus sp. MSK22-1]OMH29430.1 hypothetical protein BGP75_19440 [Motiliproteus sp. MSK22-1]
MGLKFLSFLFLITFLSLAQGQPVTVSYPRPADNVRWSYQIDLLKLALEHSEAEYRLVESELVMTQSRMVAEIRSDRLSVGWMGTSRELEKNMIPIRIPLMRGLLGYRICIIHADNQPLFSAIRRLDDWRKISIGQGLGWADVGILKDAGFDVYEATYQSLFPMLENGRFDCFLRGINEANAEVAEWKGANPNLTVEDNLLLVYPFAMFFFVSKNNPLLADQIEKGLEAAYADGSFMQYFNNHPSIRRILEDTHVASRRRFDIDNSSLSEETRLIPSVYWHDIEKP